MFALTLNNINKSYNTKKTKKIVLESCNLQIEQGTIFGLAGLNGIGKTTMIKSILDLIKDDSGEITIFNNNNQKTVSRENICYLPEKFYPSPYLTGYEFLKISLSFFGKKLNKQEVNNMAKKLYLEPNALNQVIKKYSKGMGQKLGLIYCLLSDAKLLILDEPMTGLDPQARVALKSELQNYVANGNTIFFSSHILDDVEEICDKIAVLHNGKIKFNGTPEEFRSLYPSSNIEKSFLTCINK